MGFYSGINDTLRVYLLCIGFILSLFTFQEGLLIKKHSIIDQKSQCSDVNSGKNCWIEPKYKRAVIILIDALRFDFVNPDLNDGTYYHGSMPRIGNYLKHRGDNARLFKFIADAPTTTMQRITGLITGSVPAFIEAGENFAATEILEDNLLSQLKTLNRTTVLLGDDTWVNLLPTAFTKSVPMDSFDVKDLDTVDAAIKPKLLEEVENKNFSLLISHFLGVDHCGHRYGPSHPEMRRKLNEMDVIVKKTIEKLDDDTVLFVFGDHGMTGTGDHGGDALLEVEAALFVYSKNPLTHFNSNKYKTVAQIDLLPTISLLLDIPIPFSNLGVVIDDLFDESMLQTALKLNVMQVTRYVSSYNFQNPQIQRSTKQLIQNYENQLEFNSSMSEAEIVRELRRLVFQTINNFDMNLIYIGATSFFECLLTLGVFLIANSYQTSLLSFIIFRTGLLLLQYAIYFGAGGSIRNDSSTLFYLAVYLSIAYNIAIILIALINSKWRSFIHIIPISLSFLLCIGPFSNSFIIYGAMTAKFLLSSLVLLTAYRLLQNQWSTERPKSLEKRLGFNQLKQLEFTILGAFSLILLVLRLGTYFCRCREEQIDCFETFFSIPTGLLAEQSLRLQRLALGIVCTSICFKYFEYKSKQQTLSTNFCFSFAWLGLISIYFNWTCESLALNNFRQAGIYAAQFTFILCMIILLTTIFVRTNFYEFIQSLRIVIFLVLLLLLGDGAAISLSLVLVANCIWRQHCNDTFVNAAFYFLLNQHLFYSLGHHATFSAIPWTAAFVGLPSMSNKVLPGALVIIHIYSGSIFCSIESAFCQSNLKVMHLFFGLEGLKTFMTCLAGFIQRRHLMFFKIFAPNFLFQAINFVLLSIILIFIQTVSLLMRKN